jgi:hypothetical protein
MRVFVRDLLHFVFAMIDGTQTHLIDLTYPYRDFSKCSC